MTVELATVEACPTAVVRLRVKRDDLGASIVRALDDVWAFLRASDHVTGHNVVLYREGARDGASVGAEVDVEVGVQVDRAVTPPAGAVVVASALPAGQVARAVHRGPYAGLPHTHAAVREWCDGNGHLLAGVSWEVYGDWTDDSDALETEVVYLL